MISIYSKNIQNIATEYYNDLYKEKERSIDKLKVKKNLKSELKNDLNKILIGSLSELKRLSNKYDKIISNKRFKVKGVFYPVNLSKNQIEGIFNYTNFRKSVKAFKLADKLDITCCPYCNRNYTTSHETINIHNKKKKTVFPEFDHFLPKDKYPLLAISFYNLIPSCNVCNTHFKQNHDPLTKKLFYPYTGLKKHEGMYFKFYPLDYKSLIGKSKRIVIDFKFKGSNETKEQLRNSIDFFGIKDTYEKAHSELISDIIDKRITYSAKYLEKIKSIYKLDFDTAYRILFETHYEDELLHKRPFAKLKKDIYNDLEIAKYY